jgi:apolipoprotein N-acyltransferase
MQSFQSIVSRISQILRNLAGWRADLAAGMLGAVSALALPPLHIIFVLVFVIPGLLFLIDMASGWRGALRRGFWFGFGHHIFGLYWITDAILVEAADYWWLIPIAVPGLALLLSPFIAVPCALARLSVSGWRRLLVLAGTWVWGDLARQFVFTGFPWNPLGSVWEFPGRLGDIFIQPAAWIGAPGLTLLTIFVFGLLSLSRRGLLGSLVLIVVWGGLGMLRLSQPAPISPDLRAVLVQGNVPQRDKLDVEWARQIFIRYLRLTQEGMSYVGGHPALVVWPESSFPGLLEQDIEARQIIAKAASPALATLVGSVRFVDYHQYNSLFVLSPDGNVVGLYDKWHLVPGGEYAPDWLPFAVQLVPGGGFSLGPGPRTLHVPGLPALGPLICYEAIFPGQVVDSGDRPGLLVNITNDAWFGNSSGPRQHLAAARLRAVEQGLPLIRAANTGISAAFDAYGREIGRLGLNQQGTLVVSVPGSLPLTVFSSFGLLIPFVLSCIVVVIGWVGVSKRLKLGLLTSK